MIRLGDGDFRRGFMSTPKSSSGIWKPLFCLFVVLAIAWVLK